MLLLIVM